MEKTVLITGVEGFTGYYLEKELVQHEYRVIGTTYKGDVSNKNRRIVDITNIESIQTVLADFMPDYIIHLAAISFVPSVDERKIYDVNLFGTLNLLKAILNVENYSPKKILIPSSATVYGNSTQKFIDENVCPHPNTHYGNSKLAMENMCKNWFPQLPIIITRPFNYTGVGQNINFLIPKIVGHYANNQPTIHLGNLDVTRDFSSVEFVVQCYRELLECAHHSEIINICSGIGTSINDILSLLDKISGYKPNIQVLENLVRQTEIKRLVGSNQKLFHFIGQKTPDSLENILNKMFEDDKI